MGRAVFLPQGLHQRLHDGSAQLSARLREVRKGRRGDPRRQRGQRGIAQGLLRQGRANFKLLSDPNAKVSAEYGSVMEYNGSKLSARNTFLIDPDGTIAKVFTGVKPTHSEEVLASLAALRNTDSNG